MKKSKIPPILLGLLGIVLIMTVSACRGQTLGKQPASTATAPIQYDVTSSLQSGGLTRTYIVHLPHSYTIDHALPLVLVFHGGGGKARGMNSLTNFNELADKKNFI